MIWTSISTTSLYTLHDLNNYVLNLELIILFQFTVCIGRNITAIVHIRKQYTMYMLPVSVSHFGLTDLVLAVTVPLIGGRPSPSKKRKCSTSDEIHFYLFLHPKFIQFASFYQLNSYTLFHKFFLTFIHLWTRPI